MNINELFKKYATHSSITGGQYPLMDKENFTKAIAEIISSPVEPEVMPAKGQIDPVARRMVDDLYKVCEGLIQVMEIQEKRETEEFHIPAHSFKPQWDKAKQDAREVLSNIDG